MNGPYPPISPPKVPNIRVARTVYVTSVEDPQRTKTNKQDQVKPLQIEPANYFGSEQNPENSQTAIDSRVSAIAKSLDQPPIKIESKLEPRVEPPGAVYRRRGPDPTNPKIGIISFLCEYPRARTQDIEPRKNSLQNVLFRSISERRLQFGSRQKMPAPVAVKRTSEGRRYSQIVTNGLYQEGINRSTYQVNMLDGSSKSPSRKRIKGSKLGNEVVRTVKRRVPIESLSVDGQSSIITSDQMAGSAIGPLNDMQKKRSEKEQEWNRGKQDPERSPRPLLPLHGAAESTFGVDFSSILNRHEQSATSPNKTRRAPLSTVSTIRSERFPNVRDFAEEGDSHFLKTAFRHRSKSPMKNNPPKDDPATQSLWTQSSPKKSNKWRDIGNGCPKLPPNSPNAGDPLVCPNHKDSVHDSMTGSANLVEEVPVVEMKPDKPRPWTMTDRQKQSAKPRSQQSSRSSNAKGSSTSKGHSKSLSGISGGSNDNDNDSEVSSAIISDAQSISIHKPNGETDWSNSTLARKPLRPGPAPTAPLPSLPEGHDVQPATPRRSDSSPARPSPQRSPTKSRQKVPVKYRLTPAEQSPTKKPLSPEFSNTLASPEQMYKKPAALVRIHTANVDAFPSPPLLSPGNSSSQTMAVALHETLSTSISARTLAARTEHTKKLKAKDLARRRSQTITVADESYLARPTTRMRPGMTEHTEGCQDSMERLVYSYDTQQTLPGRTLQPSPMSTSNILIADNRKSMQCSDMSPIIIVADQEPVTPQKSLSVKALRPVDLNGFGEPSAGKEVQLVSSSEDAAQHQDSRPVSEHSPQDKPQPPDKSPRRSMINRSPHKSVANRAPTPFNHPSLLRKDSQRSSQRSSLIERDLEARMVAMEKKNRWLERAFHAVMDASASISSGENFLGRDSGQSFGTGDGLSGSANGGLEPFTFTGDVMAREDDQESPHADLEHSLARQGKGRLRTLSTSSEPF